MALTSSAGLGGYATATDAKQPDARILLSRLSRIVDDLQNSSGIASGLANKLLGPRPEALNAAPQEARDPSPARTDFLTELRNLCSQLESAQANLAVHLNRVDQSF